MHTRILIHRISSLWNKHLLWRCFVHKSPRSWGKKGNFRPVILVPQFHFNFLKVDFAGVSLEQEYVSRFRFYSPFLHWILFALSAIPAVVQKITQFFLPCRGLSWWCTSLLLSTCSAFSCSCQPLESSLVSSKSLSHWSGKRTFCQLSERQISQKQVWLVQEEEITPSISLLNTQWCFQNFIWLVFHHWTNKSKIANFNIKGKVMHPRTEWGWIASS